MPAINCNTPAFIVWIYQLLEKYGIDRQKDTRLLLLVLNAKWGLCNTTYLFANTNKFLHMMAISYRNINFWGLFILVDRGNRILYEF